MKSRILVVSIGLTFLISLIFLLSCNKINQATEFGDDLVPAVDNVHTFEVALATTTNNLLFNDTTQVLYGNLVTLGDMNDPEFGHTHANTAFNISPCSIRHLSVCKKDSLSKLTPLFFLYRTRERMVIQ